MTPELTSAVAVLISAIGGLLMYLVAQARKAGGDNKTGATDTTGLLKRIVSLETDLEMMRALVEKANERIRELENKLARADERNVVLTEILERLLKPNAQEHTEE